MDYLADMETRWRPTPTQIHNAELIRAGTPSDNPIYTLHLLVNKTWGIWSANVEVIALDGVYTDRATALAALNALTEGFFKVDHRPVCGGYTTHWPNREWAVFDDICSQFGQS